MYADKASDLSLVLSRRLSLLPKKNPRFGYNSGTNHPSWYQTLPCPSPLIFKKAVDHTCSRSILGCGIHSEGNDTECVICLGAVTLRFHGNTPPGVTVTLPSFLSLPAIFWDSLGPVQRAERCEPYKRSQKTVVNLTEIKSYYFVWMNRSSSFFEVSY